MIAKKGPPVQAVDVSLCPRLKATYKGMLLPTHAQLLKLKLKHGELSQRVRFLQTLHVVLVDICPHSLRCRVSDAIALKECHWTCTANFPQSKAHLTHHSKPCNSNPRYAGYETNTIASDLAVDSPGTRAWPFAGDRAHVSCDPTAKHCTEIDCPKCRNTLDNCLALAHSKLEHVEAMTPFQQFIFPRTRTQHAHTHIHCSPRGSPGLSLTKPSVRRFPRSMRSTSGQATSRRA